MTHDNRHEIGIELKNHNASINCGNAVHMINFLFYHFHKDCKTFFITIFLNSKTDVQYTIFQLTLFNLFHSEETME